VATLVDRRGASQLYGRRLVVVTTGGNKTLGWSERPLVSNRAGGPTRSTRVDMQDFIDLQGASGASYRFRRRAEGVSHLPTAGNYVLIQEAAAGFKVLTVGVSLDLSLLRPPGAPRAGRRATHLFTRLNVARAVREREHEDLVASYKPAQVVTDEGSRSSGVS
jgi:hypothetical protein